MWTGKIILWRFHKLKQQYYYIINILIQESSEKNCLYLWRYDDMEVICVWFFFGMWDRINYNLWLNIILPRGVLVLLKFWVNSQKLGVQAPQNVEFE